MWFHLLLAPWKSERSPSRASRPRPTRRRLTLESLERRLTLSLTTLASFGGPDGADPEAALIRDSSGNLYGTTYGGGASGYGTVFELTGAATAAAQGIAASFVVRTGQPMGAAGVLAGAKRTDGGFEPKVSAPSTGPRSS
jgi:uncharacterized repeat protein (TIGR03803 family)